MHIGKEIRRVRRVNLPTPVTLPKEPERIPAPNWPVKEPETVPAEPVPATPQKGGEK